jgi:hypothetical protein
MDLTTCSSFRWCFVGIIFLIGPMACAQAPYWAPESTGGVPTTPLDVYGAPGTMPETIVGTMPGTTLEDTRGPIVARPFTLEPPRNLLGDRMKEKGVDLEYIDIEALTGMPFDRDQAPHVNTLEEYREVLSREEPSIFFDGQLYVYDSENRAYKQRDWEVKERNEALWQEIQQERRMAHQAQMQQLYRSRQYLYGSQGIPQYGTGTQPWGTSGAPTGVMPDYPVAPQPSYRVTGDRRYPTAARLPTARR